MPDTPDKRKFPAGLTKADARRAKKIATGPLMGPVPGSSSSEAQGEKAAPAPLGNMMSVKARIQKALEPDAES